MRAKRETASAVLALTYDAVIDSDPFVSAGTITAIVPAMMERGGAVF